MPVSKYWPIDPQTPVSSGFSYRPGMWSDKGTWINEQFHDGTDFAADFGTPVYAAHAGRVRNLLDPDGYGQYVQVDGQIDGKSIWTQYGHVRDMWIVPDGTWVEAGTLIAGVGSEGVGTGPHLHFRLNIMGEKTDPIPWLQDAAWGTPPPPLAYSLQTTPEGKFIEWWTINTDLPLAAIAGIAGNVQQESSFNPTITEKGWPLESLDRVAGPNAVAAGYGLYQHSFDRLWGPNGLFEWAKRENRDPSTMDTQNWFAIWEMQNLPRFAGLWLELLQVNDPYQGALVFGKFEGFNPLYEGPRNLYAVQLYTRIVKGEFGMLPRTSVPPVVSLPLSAITYPTVIHPLALGEDMASTLLIHIVQDKPEDIPPIWEYTGLVLTPFLDASLTPTPHDDGTPRTDDEGGIKRQDRSWGTFLNLYREHMEITRQNPLTGELLETAVREAAKKALEKYNAAP